MRIALVFIACVLIGCDGSSPGAVTTHSTQQSQQPPVLTNAADLDRHVGQVVKVRGTVQNTKIPTIIGVDVSSFDPDLRGQDAEATGILQHHVVTPEEIANANYANRGPGVFYRLKDLDSDYEAAVRPVLP